MATFGQRLGELRAEHGLTMDELVDAFIMKYPDVKLDRSKISRYERDLTKPSRFEVVECLSYFFGVTPGYLMGRSKHKRHTPFRKIPVLNRYSVGRVLQMQEEVSHYEYVDEEDARSFGVISCAAIPSARIAPGDIVYIDRKTLPENGNLVLAAMNSGPLLVRYYEANGSVIFRPEEAGRDAAVLKKDDAQIIGKAISFKAVVK